MKTFSKSSGPRELTRYQTFAVFAIIEVDPGERGEEVVIREAAENDGRKEYVALHHLSSLESYD